VLRQQTMSCLVVGPRSYTCSLMLDMKGNWPSSKDDMHFDSANLMAAPGAERHLAVLVSLLANRRTGCCRGAPHLAAKKQIDGPPPVHLMDLQT
jgi:hypothetical protein